MDSLPKTINPEGQLPPPHDTGERTKPHLVVNNDKKSSEPKSWQEQLAEMKPLIENGNSGKSTQAEHGKNHKKSDGLKKRLKTYGGIITQTIKNVDAARGGRGTTGDPVAIRASLKDADIDITRAERNALKLKNDKDELLFDLADLRIKEKQAQYGNLSDFTKKDIHRRIKAVERELNKINGVLPESNTADDHKKIQKIIDEWKEGKRDWKKELLMYTKAEERLEKHPENRHAQGEANRARAALQETEKQLEQIAAEAGQIESATTSSPTQEDEIRHTAEETRAEKEYLEKRKGGTPDLVQGRNAKTMFNDRVANEIMQRDMDSLASETLEEKPTTINMEQTPNIADVPFEHEKRASGDQTPLDFTMEEKKNPFEDALLRTKARTEEVSKRQSELANETSPDAMLEKVELEKELASLEKRREEVESKLPKKSAYDTAMDKLWVENEAKRKQEEDRIAETTIGHGTQDSAAAKAILAEIKKLGGSQEQPVGTIIDSEGAVKALEGRIANETKEKTHEELHKERTEAFNELFTKKMGVLNEMEGEAQARTEKTGWRFAMDSIGKVGERWNNFKKEHKYGYAAALILAGSGGLATGTIFAGGAMTAATATLRALSGAGMFYSKEKEYERKAKEEGRTRTEGEVGADRLKAVLWGVLMGGLLGHVLGTVAHEVGENLASLEVSGMAKGVTSESVSETEPTPSNETVAEAREQVWPREEKMLEWKQTTIENTPAETETHEPPTEHKGAEITEHARVEAEYVPGDPKILVHANQIIDNNLNQLFGTKGIFGLGAKNWLDTLNMKDPTFGFANKSVDEILQVKLGQVSDEGVTRFGINNDVETEKMQNVLKKAMADTGVKPMPNENSIDFLRRATSKKVLEYMNKS